MSINLTQPAVYPSRCSVDYMTAKMCIVMDFIPYGSTLTNLVAIFLKVVLGSTIMGNKLQSFSQKSHYFKHIHDKSYLECVILLIPWLGNLIWIFCKLGSHKNSGPSTEGHSAQVTVLNTPSVQPSFMPIAQRQSFPSFQEIPQNFDRQVAQFEQNTNQLVNPIPQPQQANLNRNEPAWSMVLTTEEQVNEKLIKPIRKSIEDINKCIDEVEKIKSYFKDLKIKKQLIEGVAKDFKEEIKMGIRKEIQNLTDRLKVTKNYLTEIYRFEKASFGFVESIIDLYGPIERYPRVLETLNEYRRIENEIKQFIEVTYDELLSSV